MVDFDTELSLDQLKKASEFVWNSGECRRTPMILGIEDCLPLSTKCRLNLKMECAQVTGSFKFRGAYHQMAHLERGQEVFTYSGGNYGTACATMSQKLGLKCTVLMPKSAPKDRMEAIRNLGAEPEVYDTMYEVCTKRDEYKSKGITYLDPFDDLKYDKNLNQAFTDLIKGYASIGLEILEAVPNPDIVVIPCGGGGLLSGTAAALAQAGPKGLKIYGVEPVTAATMYKSFQLGRPAEVPDSHSVANGLCPTRSGDLTTPICRRFVEEILLVNEEEIIQAVRALYDIGIRVEASGAATVAALISGKIPKKELEGKTIVAVLSGRNVTIQNLSQLVG